jgi:phospholipase C
MASDGAIDGQYTMGYFTRDDVPFQYALADAFTILDSYHCSVLGPTGPNRHMWMSGTLDPNGLGGRPIADHQRPAERVRLDDLPRAAAGSRRELEDLPPAWRPYRRRGNQQVDEVRQRAAGRPDLDNGVATQPLGQFEYDAMNDQLPTVSWILPPTGFDEHPAALPAAGATFVAGKIDAIAANPEVWAKTVFILSYDENDGMFDHVPPPTPPAGTPDEFVFKTSNTGEVGGGLPIGLGFRVLPLPSIPGAKQSMPRQEPGHRPHVR